VAGIGNLMRAGEGRGFGSSWRLSGLVPDRCGGEERHFRAGVEMRRRSESVVVPFCRRWRGPRGRSAAARLRPGQSPRFGSRAFGRRGQLFEERADPESFLGAVPEQAVGVDGVQVPAAGPRPREVAGGYQVGHDGLDGALGQADDGADVADPGSRVAGDLHQHVPVPGQQCPAAAGCVRIAHSHEYNLAQGDSREKTREDLLTSLLTGIWRRADACATASEEVRG
jgi:hypothetical protein